MKKIKSQEERDAEDKRNRLIIGIVMIGLIVLSTLGFAVSNFSGSTSSNTNQDVYFDGSNWIYSVGSTEYKFKNSVDEVSDVVLNFNKNLGDYAGQELYVDSLDSASLIDISQTLGRFSGRLQEACYGNCERDLPERDCSVNLIVVKESSVKRVYQEDNCIFIEGGIESTDAFLFRILGFN